MTARRVTVAAVLALVAVAAAIELRPGVRSDASARARVVACMRSGGWSQTARHENETVLTAADHHAQLELSFWRSVAAARRSIGGLAALGDGWAHRVSFHSSLGFTIADEQTVYRCLSR